MNVYIDGVLQGGGGGSLPDTPVAVLLDASAPDTFVGLDGTGAGQALTPSGARTGLSMPARLTGQVTLSAWTQGSSTGGAAVTQGTGPSRLSFTVPATTAGGQTISRIDLIPDEDTYDVAMRVQVVTGNGAASVRIALGVGVDLNNRIVVEMDTAGMVEALRVVGGSIEAVTTVPGSISSGQLTGGQLWLRARVEIGAYRAYWGVGTGGEPPTSWTVIQTRNDANAAVVSLGAYASVLVGTLDTSVAALAVDVLDVRAVGISGAVL